MKKIYKPITKINFYITGLVLSLYAIIRFRIVFLRVTPKGDERSFLSVFNIVINKGFYEANVAGNSTPFNFVAYLFYKITSNGLISLRLTSLFFGILSLVFLWIFYKKYFKIPQDYRFTAFLTAVNTMVIMSWVFTGINDIILAFLTVLLFMIIFRIKNDQKESHYSYLYIGLIIAFMLLTRKMSLLFLPSVFVVLISILYLKNTLFKAALKKIILVSASFLIIVIAFNIPSLIEKGHLSFHEKKLPSEKVNWSQLQYLTAIREEQGSLSYGKHASIDEVIQYLNENGENSLPKTLTASIFFDFARTTREFFNDLFYQIKPFTRLLGFIFLTNLLLLIRYFFKRKFIVKNILNQPIILFSIIYMSIVCFIVITYVETRWFSNILLLLPIVLAERTYKFIKENNLGEKFDFIMINLQLLSLTVMSLPYLIKNIGILF
ncbi:MAG: glycosyltransferase family 39 protein [Flavobacteriaceae bacterium]